MSLYVVEQVLVYAPGGIERDVTSIQRAGSLLVFRLHRGFDRRHSDLRQMESVQCPLRDICDLRAADADQIVNDERSELPGGVKKELVIPAVTNFPVQGQDR